MSSKIRLFGLVEDSIVDGPSLRLAIFTQGCLHNCTGCHNPESHALDGGYLESVDVIVEKAISNPLCDGVTFSGGEPLLQIEAVFEIAKKVKAHGLSTILYTGYVFEEILEKEKNNISFQELLQNLDFIIDGPYIEKLRTLSLPFRGSSNQRMIDVKATLKDKTLVHN